MDFPTLGAGPVAPKQATPNPPASQASKRGKGRKQQQQVVQSGPAQTVSKAQTWGLGMFKDTSAADIEAQRAELNRIEASQTKTKQKPLKTDD